MAVSRASKLPAEEVTTWRNRKLGSIDYPVLDARYEKVRHGGSDIDCAAPVAIGVDKNGKHTVIDTSVAFSGTEVHRRAPISSLRDWHAWCANGRQ